MSSRSLSRRRCLQVGATSLVGLGGCLADGSGSKTRSSTETADGTTTTEQPTEPDTPTLASLSVADFVVYPLAGTHPHVHRRADVQYVVVRLDTSLSMDRVRADCGLQLDGESIPLAERQPVPWAHDTVDLAFAVSKSTGYEEGRLSFGGTDLRSLAAATLDRLNNPPVFTVSNVSVSPDELQAGAERVATVTFDLANTGTGRGTFGASLSGNVTSGSRTLTATLDPGTERSLSEPVEVWGRDDSARVRLDWGADEWSTTIPVVGTTTVEGTTATPPPQ
ncbi:hypothetical protein QA599_15000 [Haloarculaceae archaeon H-GB1-1]|nr:hypothetical protein [Haloarculaceae archaeon H-GB1-1]